MTTEITATIHGRPENLKDVLVCAIRHESRRQLTGDTLTVRFCCETDNYDAALTDVMDLIDLEQLEGFGCELVAIG